MGILQNLTHPKKLINNSMWFKQDVIDVDSTAKNLFIISHLGQLSQIEALIEYENLKDNFLVVVYASTNTKMPKLIEEKYNRELFKDFYLFLLPDAPNDMQIKKLLYMRRNYVQLFNKVSPENIFCLSFEGHYNLLLFYAKRKGCKLCLVEEGTATYKSEIGYDDKSISTFVKVKTYLLKSFLVVGKLLILLRKIRQFKTQVKRYKNFDKIYASFPDLVEDKFNAKQVEKFFVYGNEVKNRGSIHTLIEKYQMSSNDFIYVNQRYPIESREFAQAIISILSSVAKTFESKVFIKMHPKDTLALKQAFVNEIRQNYLSEFIIFLEESEFLIEPTISMVKPKAVLGLTSTTLVYVPLVSPKTQVYSIALPFLKIVSQNSYNQNGASIISEHLEILKDFHHVVVLNENEQLSKELLENNSLIVQSLNKSKESNEKEIIQKIKKMLNENKYQKALIYIKEFYPNYDLMSDEIKSLYEIAYEIKDKTEEETLTSLVKKIQLEEEYRNYKNIVAILSPLDRSYVFSMPVETIKLYFKALKIEKQNEKLFTFLEQTIEDEMSLTRQQLEKQEEIILLITSELVRFFKLELLEKLEKKIQNTEDELSDNFLIKFNFLKNYIYQNYEEAIRLFNSLDEISEHELFLFYINILLHQSNEQGLEILAKKYNNSIASQIQSVIEISKKILLKENNNLVKRIEQLLLAEDLDENIRLYIILKLIDLHLKDLSLAEATAYLKVYEENIVKDADSTYRLIRLQALKENWDKVESYFVHWQETILFMPIEMIELYIVALAKLNKSYKLVQMVSFLLDKGKFSLKIISLYIEHLIMMGDWYQAKETIEIIVEKQYKEYSNLLMGKYFK